VHDESTKETFPREAYHYKWATKTIEVVGADACDINDSK
jgi:hypothetical protein